MSNQVRKSFNNKWGVLGRNYGKSPAEYFEILEHFSSILGVRNMDGIRKLYKDDINVLDAGCGVASIEALFNINPKTNIYAIDLAEDAVEVAKDRLKDFKNIEVINANLFDLPYEKEFFDIIMCDGVLHHTPDPRGGFKKLCWHLKSGGLIGIYIYNVKPKLRELIDTEIRKETTEMNFKDCYEFSQQMTLLGKSLSKFGTELVIEKDIPLLDIKAGKYSLQRFIYDHFIKCYWNEALGEEFSSLVNFDWYSPKLASHHTKKEIKLWFEENNILNPKFIQPKGYEHSGYFVTGRKE